MNAFLALAIFHFRLNIFPTSSTLALVEHELLQKVMGGDTLQNIIWRALWGGMPTTPQKVILCAGTNNIKSTSTWEAQLIASSIVDFTRYLLKTYLHIELAVMSILQMREQAKSRQADSINNTLRFKLPLGVRLLEPHSALFDDKGNCNNNIFCPRGIHLNLVGYQILLKFFPSFHLSSNTHR